MDDITVLEPNDITCGHYICSSRDRVLNWSKKSLPFLTISFGRNRQAYAPVTIDGDFIQSQDARNNESNKENT